MFSSIHNSTTRNSRLELYFRKLRAILLFFSNINKLQVAGSNWINSRSSRFGRDCRCEEAERRAGQLRATVVKRGVKDDRAEELLLSRGDQAHRTDQEIVFIMEIS